MFDDGFFGADNKKIELHLKKTRWNLIRNKIELLSNRMSEIRQFHFYNLTST